MQASNRVRVALSVFAGAGAVLALFGQWLVAATDMGHRLSSLWPEVIGLGIFAVAVGALNAPRPPRRLARGLETTAKWFGVRPWQLAGILLAPIFAVITALAAGGEEKMLNPPLALGSWAAALASLLLGTWAFSESTEDRYRGRTVRSPRPSNSDRQSLADRFKHTLGLGRSANDRSRSQRLVSETAVGRRWEIVGLVLLGLAAFAVRAWNTTHIPIFLTGDEGSAGLEAVRAVKGEINNLFAAGWYGFPQLYFMLQSLSVRALGASTAAIRLPSALVGALTVIVTYFLGKAFYGSRAGWVAAIFLAGFHFHIHFSRIALNNVWDGLWFVVTLAALWSGWKGKGRAAYVVAGLALGLSQYFYSSARALVILIAVWVVLAAFLDRARLKNAVAGLLSMLVSALVVALPTLWDFTRRPNEYLAPFRRFGVFSGWLTNEVVAKGQPALLILLNKVIQGFGSFTFLPLQVWYEPDTPMLRWLPAGVFLLGVLLLALRWRDHRSMLLLLWLLAFIAIASFSDSTPAAQRLVAVAPACALVIGYAVHQVCAALETRFPNRTMVFSAVALCGALVLALDDVNFYFNIYTPHVRMLRAHTNDAIAQGLVAALQNTPADYEVVFLGSGMGYHSIPSVQYLAPQSIGVDVDKPWGDPGNPQIAANRLLFVFVPERKAEIPAVQAAFPGGALATVPAADGDPLFWTYQWPAQAATQLWRAVSPSSGFLQGPRPRGPLASQPMTDVSALGRAAAGT